MVSDDSHKIVAVYLRIEDTTLCFSEVSQFTLKIHIIIA